jgi:hypothetical protein
MVTSAPRPLKGSLPSLSQVLGLSLDETAESGHAKAMIHIMFQVIGPSCTPVPVEIDLESTSTIANSKVALALLLSGADYTAVLEKPRTEPVILGGIAPGQLQLVHAGGILGDHVLLRSLQGMMPAGDPVLPPKTMGEPRLCFTPDPCSSPPLNHVDRSQPHLSSSDGGLDATAHNLCSAAPVCHGPVCNSRLFRCWPAGLGKWRAFGCAQRNHTFRGPPRKGFARLGRRGRWLARPWSVGKLNQQFSRQHGETRPWPTNERQAKLAVLHLWDSRVLTTHSSYLVALLGRLPLASKRLA